MLGLAQMGGFLFTKFRYIELTTQHRSGDPNHMALINKTSKTGVGPTVQDLKSTFLSREDMESDDFRFATTLSLVIREKGYQCLASQMSCALWCQPSSLAS